MKNTCKDKYDPKAERMVRAIGHDDNVTAYNCLEKIIKERVSKKIDKALAEQN